MSATGDPPTEYRDLLIDTDVHEGLRSVEDLLPYLDSYWQRSVRENIWAGPPRFQYVVPLPSKAASRVEWELGDGTAGTDLDAMRRHLFEGEQVDIGILDGLYHFSAMPVDFEFAQALASAYNDWQIENWLEPEPRLRGSVHVVADDPAAAAREIDRVAEHPQIVQVFLPTVTDREYGDPLYHPIFEAAIRNDLVVTFHHGEATKTALGYPRHVIQLATVGFPMATANQLVSLICNGVFDKYPQLRTVFLEAGVAWLPWLMWRLDHKYRELRVNVPWVKRLPSEHIRDNVRIATQPLGDLTADQFLTVIEMTETDRVFVFATDYPHYDSDTADAVLPGRLPNNIRQRIRHQNAIETYPRMANLNAEIAA